MRGDRLMNSLFPDEETTPAAEKSRGRHDTLIKQRNERLCARVYYLRTFKRMRNEDILAQLQAEFDISTVTIPQILQEEQWQEELMRLRNKKPNLKWFKTRWGWMKW